MIDQRHSVNFKRFLESNERFGSLLLVAGCYGLIAFLCGGATFQFAPYSGSAAIIFLALWTGSIVVTSAFAALGEGPYWKRLIICQLFCGSVGACFLLGAFIFSPRGPNSNFKASALLLPQLQLWLVSSIGAQFPFGLMRAIRHWQLHHRMTPRAVPFSIGDLMTLTVFVSIAMGLANWNVDTGSNASPDSISAHWIRRFGMPLTAFGLASCLFGIPILALVNQTKDVETGCLIQFGVVSAILFIVLLPLMAIGSPATLLMSLVGFVTGVVTFTSLPLCAAKTEGFVLTKEPIEDESLA